MRVNIYIRKDNEDAWSKLSNKSDWVNKQFDKMVIPMTPAQTEVTVPAATKKITQEKIKYCKHGNSKGECFAKDAYRLKCNVL